MRRANLLPWARARVVPALLLLTVGCGPTIHETAPGEIVGLYRTEHPDYSDRVLVILYTSVIFTDGDGDVLTHPITSVVEQQAEGGIRYDIEYAQGGNPYVLSVIFRPGRTATLRFRNQPQLLWERTRR